MTDFGQVYSYFSVGHNTLFFSFIAVISVFTIDMLRFKRWSLSSLSFTSASVAGMLVGTILLEFLPLAPDSMNIIISVVATAGVSAVVALKLQTLDAPVQRRARRGS